MHFQFFDGEDLIGGSEMWPSDPSMGVAQGAFEPTATYRRERHANEVDGDHIGYNGLALHIRSGTKQVDAIIHIQDYQDSLQERLVSIKFADGSHYAEFFPNAR